MESIRRRNALEKEKRHTHLSTYVLILHTRRTSVFYFGYTTWSCFLLRYIFELLVYFLLTIHPDFLMGFALEEVIILRSENPKQAL